MHKDDRWGMITDILCARYGLDSINIHDPEYCDETRRLLRLPAAELEPMHREACEHLDKAYARLTASKTGDNIYKLGVTRHLKRIHCYPIVELAAKILLNRADVWRLKLGGTYVPLDKDTGWTTFKALYNADALRRIECHPGANAAGERIATLVVEMGV